MSDLDFVNAHMSSRKALEDATREMQALLVTLQASTSSASDSLHSTDGLNAGDAALDDVAIDSLLNRLSDADRAASALEQRVDNLNESLDQILETLGTGPLEAEGATHGAQGISDAAEAPSKTSGAA